MILPILTSAFLLYLAFPNIFFLQGFPFFAWIFAIPFFFCLEKRNLTGRLKAGFLFGLVSNLALVNWMIPYSFPGYLLLCFALAIQSILFAVFYRPLRKNKFWNIFYVAGMWVASEYLRKILMLGESWNLAHSQTMDIPLMQMANLLGSPAISFVLIAMNYALYQAMDKRENLKTKMNSVLATMVLFAIVYGYGFWTLAHGAVPVGAKIKVCVLQTDHDYRGDLSDEKISAIVDQNIRLTREAIAVGSAPDLVVWPETAIPTDFLEDPILRGKIVSLAREMDASFLVGAAIHGEAGDLVNQHNSAVLINRKGEIQQIYHKRHLIPLTEFIPDAWGWKIFAKIFRVTTPQLVEGNPAETGMMAIHLRDGHLARFGVAICSEDNIDRVFREYRRRGAQFVVVLLNNGWFTQKAGFVMHAQHSMVRAVENHFPVIRSGNAGWSGLIDEWGGTSDKSLSMLGESNFFNIEIPLSSEKSRSNNLDDTFCLLCVAFVILIQISTIKKDQ
jgi:apolipoprotein N-acyltransferase